MRDNIVKLDKHIKDLSKEELIEKLGSLKKSELMRSIILNERDYCTCTYERSQRSFWYSVVKPTLDKLGKLTSDDDTEEKIERWDSDLSRYLTELVRNGQLTYKDIMIKDESRNMNVPEEYYFSPYRNIVVCCEKDTIFNIVNDISVLLGCSCMSSKGICGYGAMENLMRQIRDNSENNYNDIVFLILSDYDPTGYTIAKTFKEQAEEMARNLHMNCVVTAKRIGIVPDQLTDYEVKNNMYTPKKKGLDDWVKLTGGIEGKAKGLELDALTPDRIREIFASNLQTYIDSSEYLEHGKVQYLYGLIREEIDVFTRRIADKVYEEMENNVDFTDFNMMDYVKEGKRYMPVGEIYSVNGSVADCVRKYFE